MPTEKPLVLVAVLCGSERHQWLNPKLVLVLLQMQGDPRFDITIKMVLDQRQVDRARNVAIVTARDSGATWVIQIDNDVCPPENLLDILASADASGKDIVGLGYAVLFDGQPKMIPSDHGLRDGEFRQTGCTGAGVLLIHKKVWETILGPWFRWVTNDDETTTLKIGEDFYFCELVQRSGFTLWTHCNPVAHFRTTDISSLV